MDLMPVTFTRRHRADIVGFEHDASELFRRILAEDEDERVSPRIIEALGHMRSARVAMKFLSFAAVLSLLGGPILAAETRPNILFAIADDWGAHAGAYGTAWVTTPAFDRVAREGLLFQNAFTPVAKCAPSRAIVLTGRHAWQNEEAGNHLAFFPAGLTRWPEVLREHGWHMGITGKGWGPGIAHDASGRPRQIAGQPFNERKASPPARHVSSNDYAANFVDFLDAAPQGAPWCFWYGSTEPHRDYEFQAGVHKGGKQLADIDQAPRYWPDDPTVRQDMLDYAFEVEHADDHLGRMIAELDKRGLLETTLIIVTSDHGMPFPRVKGYAYHDANHVPLAIRWPAGNPETGYLDTDGSPTKSLILERGRKNRADRFWQLNFARRPADELYDLVADTDCVTNLATDPSRADRLAVLRERMEAELKDQGDPRMAGRGHVFDEYEPTKGAGFYEQFMRGEKPDAGWVNPTDFEKEPVDP